MSEDVYPPTPTRLVASGGGAELPEPPEPFYPSEPGGGRGGGRQPTTTSSGGPGGPGFNRQQFIKSYANMVAQTWVDDQYLDLILASPAETLAKAGLPTPAGATIRIVQHKITGTGQVADQVDAWVEGNRTGLFDLFLPMKPEDVDVGAGGAVSAEGGASCCCSPCCCCT